MITFSGNPDKPPLRAQSGMPKPYVDTARQAWFSFPAGIRHRFEDEGVELVLSSRVPESRADLAANPLADFYGVTPDDDHLSPVLSPRQGENAWVSLQRFYRQVVQGLAHTLRALSPDLLFDDDVHTAFDDDYQSIDVRLGMMMTGITTGELPDAGTSDRIRDFRHHMAEGRGGLRPMIEALGYCIAEYCTGESTLTEILPGIRNPAASFFPELYRAVEEHLGINLTPCQNFLDKNPGLQSKLSPDELPLLKNLLSDPLGPLHHNVKTQQRHADLAARTLGLMMENTPEEDRREQFIAPCQEIRAQVWALWRRLQDDNVLIKDDEAIKLVSCLDRTDFLLKALETELPKDDRYDNGDVVRLFHDIQNADNAGDDMTAYLVAVLTAWAGENSGNARQLIKTFYGVSIRLEASGEEAAARTADRLTTRLAEALKAR